MVHMSRRINSTAATIELNPWALRTIRDLLGISQGQLAKAIDRDRSYVAKLESESGGIVRVPAPIAKALATQLGLKSPRAILANPRQPMTQDAA